MDSSRMGWDPAIHITSIISAAMDWITASCSVPLVNYDSFYLKLITDFILSDCETQ